jgi:hypothetical protein
MYKKVPVNPYKNDTQEECLRCSSGRDCRWRVKAVLNAGTNIRKPSTKELTMFFQ